MRDKLFLSTSALALLWSGAVCAQSAPPATDTPQAGQPAAQPSGAAEEVVVTAERRTTNLQTTPIAASVFSGADLANKGVTSVDQLQTAMPSVTIQNFGQGNDFNIRGIGKGEQTSATLVGVVTYHDGVANFPGYFQDEPFYDISSLEVLRGPQGTFAGQNAIGGAVFITETNPDFNGLHGYVQGGYGNYNDGSAQGAVNVPISDTLAVRIAINDEYRDSFYTVTGPYTGSPGLLQTSSARFSALWVPTEALKVLFKTDYNYINQGGLPADPVNSPNDIFHITSNAHSLYYDEFVRSVLDVSYQFPDGITARSVSGYQHGISAAKIDLDGTSLLPFTFTDHIDEEIYSEEVNLISPDQGPLTWVAGLYYSYDRMNFPGYDIGEPTGIFDTSLHGSNPKQTEAIFGQVSYDLPAGFQVQVGARETAFRTTNDVAIAIPEFGLRLPDRQSEHDSKLTGKIALNWKIDPNNFLYSFVATGHKGGGLNIPTGLALPATFKPEDVTDYEFGWKATSFGGHLKTQLGGYYNDYKNFQVSIGDPNNPTQSLELNVPNTSEIYGLEAQAQATFGALSFDFGGSLLHSQLGTFYAVDPRFPGAAPCSPTSGPASGACQNVTGKQNVYAPTLTFNIGAQYVYDVGNGDTVIPRANFGHVGSQWSTLFENSSLGDRLDARNLLSAQIAYEHGDWVATAEATNLTGQEYVSAINGGLRYAGAPRQFGLKLMRTF